MARQIQLATNRLFGENELNVTEFKLFLGDDRYSTPDLIAGEISKALMDIEAGDFELLSLED